MNAELLLVSDGLRNAATVENARSGWKHQRFLHLAAREAARPRVHHFELADGGNTDALDLGESTGGGATTSAKQPKRAINALASGVKSRWGMARNSTRQPHMQRPVRPIVVQPLLLDEMAFLDVSACRAACRGRPARK